MSDRRDIRSSLKSVGDSYLERNPADHAKVRAELGSKRRRLFIRSLSLSVAAIGTAVLVAVAVVSLPSDREGRSVAAGPFSVSATIDVGAVPVSVHAKGGSAWASVEGNVVVGLDVDNEAVSWTSDLSSSPSDVLPGAGEVWATLPEEDLVVAFDAATGQETHRFALPDGSSPTRLTVGARALRTVADGNVLRVELASGEISTLYAAGDAVEIAMGSHAFWVLTDSGRIVGIDPDTGVEVDGLTPTVVEPGGEITYARGELWYGRDGETLLQMIDESTGGDAVDIELPGGYVDLDAGGPGAWALVSTGDASGTLVDLVPGQGVLGSRSKALAGDPVDISIATGGGGIWAALAEDREIVRIEP